MGPGNNFRVAALLDTPGATVRARLRLSRPVAGPEIFLQLDLAGGSATGADHNLGGFLTMTLANNATSTEVFINATADTSLEGWETLLIKPNFGAEQVSLDVRNPLMVFLADNVADPEALPAADYDLDGLPDRWEVANGLDPFDATDAQADTDKDGLINADEYQARTSPQLADTDGDGLKDLNETLPNLALDPDYVEVRLVTKDTGKVNNGANCAVCHTTELRVGDARHYTLQRGEFSEKTFYFRKGTNYPMWLSELIRNLPPTGASGNSPATTATYSAAVLPGTNQPAAFVLQDPQTKLGTNKPWSQFPANPNVSFGTLVVPRIEVLFTNFVGNTPLDTNPNEGGGLRFYPDQLSPTDLASTRDRLRVRVKTTPPLPLQYVRLRWFDVDDPFEHRGGDAEFLIDPNDQGGVKGNDNKGDSGNVLLAQTQLLLDNQGEAVTDFTVSKQPGDNFRVAVVLDTAGALAHLNQLQVTNPAAPYYVAPGTNHVPGFVGAVSPMLTVWRKLHLEFDSMTAPPASGAETPWIRGKVTFAAALALGPNRSLVKVFHTEGERKARVFERGKLEIAGLGTYRINKSSTESSVNGNFISTLDVEGNIGTLAMNREAKLYDDDDQFLTNDPLYPSVLNLNSPPLPALLEAQFFVNAAQSRFAGAYITLVNANAMGWNTLTTIPFKRNEPVLNIAGSVVFDSGNLQLKGTDRPAFWAFSVVFGYQPVSVFRGIPAGLEDDGDPNTEIPLRGGTPETGLLNVPFGYSVIFMEAIRDHEFSKRLSDDPAPADFNVPVNQAPLTGRYLSGLYGTIAHEVGHAPGGQGERRDHHEAGLMDVAAPPLDVDQFTPATLNRFRNAASWTQ